MIRAFRSCAVALALAALAACGAPFAHAAPAAPAPAEIRVFAAASLTDAFSAIARDFEAAHAGVRVRLVLAGSPQLVGQLAQGASGDVLATADTRNMDDAKSKQLLAGEPSTFARNRLALIVPATNPGRLRAWPDLAKRGLKLVIGSDALPVGHYAREMFHRLEATGGEGWAKRALGNVVSEEENVKAVLAKVQLGEADAGVVYRTDVTPALARYVRVLPVPDAANPAATYPVAVLARAPHPELARAFVDAVLSRAGQAVLAKRGFLAPAGAP